MDRIPETWKPYFAVSVGDPVARLEHLNPVWVACWREQLNRDSQ